MVDKEILGEWVNTSPYDDKGECSRCCYVSKKYYSFCPNCGADMRCEKAGMTNKQAAEILKAYSYHDILPQDVKDALEIAIKIVNEVIDETDCSGESKTTSTAEVNLDCWQNEPILLTSNPPKLLWKCRFCGKEITTKVSEIPTTPCNCLKENKVMPKDQSSDVDMQIRIIKGDLQYLSEKVDKLSSLIDEQKTER